MPVKFYPDLLRFSGVIREKPILSNYILCCHAYAWQRRQIAMPCTEGLECVERRKLVVHYIATRSVYSRYDIKR